MTTGLSAPQETPTAPTSGSDVETLVVPDLEPPHRWATLTPAESATTATYRHIVAEGAAKSVCGTTALPAIMWRLARGLPACPVCVHRHLHGDPPDVDDLARIVVQRRSDPVRGGTQVIETRYPSKVEKAQARRDAVRQHVTDPSHAEHLIALVEAGLLSLDISRREVDDSGTFEDADGNMVRNQDVATTRTQSRLVLRSIWFDPGPPAQAPTQASTDGDDL